MLNTMVIVKMNNCTYDDWKKAFDADSASDAEFMRDVIVGKVDDHTAIVVWMSLTLKKCRQCLKIQR